MCFRALSAQKGRGKGGGGNIGGFEKKRGRGKILSGGGENVFVQSAQPSFDETKNLKEDFLYFILLEGKGA